MSQSESTSPRLYRLSLAHPIWVPVALYLIAWILRVVDIMALPLAESTGEAFLHKALGFLMVLVYVWAAGQSIRAIGLHGRSVGEALLIGGVTVAAVYLVAFGIQWSVSSAAGNEPRFVFTALDPCTGLEGGLGFALWLFVGNLVNSFMEEGPFRGVMLTHFRRRLTPWRANILQAVIFGLWHIAWPIQHYLTGDADAAGALSEAVTIAIASSVSGLAYGYLYLETDSLWAPWLGHTVNNTILNLTHLRTVDGLDADLGVLHVVMMAGFLLILPWIAAWAKRLHLPQLSPWGAPADREPVPQSAQSD
jgi:membrane protease YdiL (CAAX protease family)